MIIVTLVFEMIRFEEDNSAFSTKENEKSAFSNFPGLKSVFKEHRFRHGFVWTLGPTREIPPMWCGRKWRSVVELHISAFAVFHGILAVNLA